MSGQTCTEFAAVHCCIPERISSHSLLMSLLVKGWRDHRLSIKEDCQSQAVSNSAVIYTPGVKNRTVLKRRLLCPTACAGTQIKYVEQRFKGKKKISSEEENQRKLDSIALYRLPLPFVVIIIQRRNQGTCNQNSQCPKWCH